MDFEEEDLYEIVADEIASGNLKRGIWAKAYADAEGNTEKAQAQYIKLRVKQLSRESFTTPTTNTPLLSGPEISLPEPPEPSTSDPEPTDPEKSTPASLHMGLKSVALPQEEIPTFWERKLIKTKPPTKKPIEGWLIIFCCGLTIGNPIRFLSTFGNYKFTLENPDLFTPSYLKLVQDSYEFVIMTSGMMTLYAVTAGIMIWLGTSSGRSIARAYLLISFGFSIIMNLAMLAQGIMFSMTLTALLVNTLAFLIWWLYFKNSKRVLDTYGPETNS